MQRQSQTARILQKLKEDGQLSNIQLNNMCYRYSARIKELRDEGHIIVSHHIKDSLWVYVYKGEKPMIRIQYHRSFAKISVRVLKPRHPEIQYSPYYNRRIATAI